MDESKSLEAEAIRRKERLAALKKSKGATNASNDEASGSSDTILQTLPKPVFRSYQPKDEGLQESTMPRVAPPKAEDAVKDHLAAGKSDVLVNEIDLANLAPRKPDWDLKRDVSKQLEKLSRRTERSIAELIREKLAEGKEDMDIAQVVNASQIPSSKIV